MKELCRPTKPIRFGGSGGILRDYVGLLKGRVEQPFLRLWEASRDIGERFGVVIELRGESEYLIVDDSQITDDDAEQRLTGFVRGLEKWGQQYNPDFVVRV